MLKEKDPEFYKYLEENDRELLEFSATPADADSMDLLEEGEESEGIPELSQQELRGWQRALLEVDFRIYGRLKLTSSKYRSLRALRKLMLAFRSAAYANDEDATVAWKINDATCKLCHYYCQLHL